MADGSGQTPGSVALLGWLGVIPFLGFALSIISGRLFDHVSAIHALVAYGAAILSFLGGIQWGVAMSAQRLDGQSHARAYGLSVLPALLAWSCLGLAPLAALTVLAMGFALWLAYDVWTARHGETPPWFPRLRAPITAVVVLCLVAPGLALALS
jgi:hypothetical protein